VRKKLTVEQFLASHYPSLLPDPVRLPPSAKSKVVSGFGPNPPSDHATIGAADVRDDYWPFSSKEEQDAWDAWVAKQG